MLWYIAFINKAHWKKKTLFFLSFWYLRLWPLNKSFKETSKSPLQRVPRLLHSELLSQPVVNFKNHQGPKCDWFYFALFYLFIFSYYVIAKQKLKPLVLLSMFPAGLLIFLSSLIPDPQFSSVSQLMPLLAWLHLNSVAPVATTCWETAFWVLSRKALCFIDLDFNFKYYSDWSGTWKQMFWEAPLLYGEVIAKFCVHPSNKFKKIFHVLHYFILYNINKVLEKSMVFENKRKLRKLRAESYEARRKGKGVPDFNICKCYPL